MSTSQKRSNPGTKNLRDTEEMSSVDSQELSANSPLTDAESAAPDAKQDCEDSEDVDLESSNEAKLPPEAREEQGDKKAEDNREQDEDEVDDEEEDEDEDEDEDDYDQRHRHADQDGLFSSGGSMGGLVSGVSSRLKGILANLRAYEDPSLQLIALQDLAVLLSVSTEDTLSGYISNDAFVKELVILMRGNGDDDDNPEIMLLACRCMSNLMEAMPYSIASVLHGGAISVLCSKLLEIQYIDLAEQSLTTLEKISSEYPQAVVKEGGLAAVLMFLDFFSTNVQRTAVKTAANCCRSMQSDSIAMVQDILPNLENIIQYSDQKIVEHVCQCFVNLAQSFRSHAAHLQTIFTKSILRAILSLLSPNTNVALAAQTYTSLLRVLSTVAQQSPTLGSALLEMDVVDTLFLVLTGTHAPDSSRADDGPLRVSIMGARPMDQVSEIINIFIELLPPLPKDDGLFDTDYRYAKLKKEGGASGQLPESEDIEMQGADDDDDNVDKRQKLIECDPDRVQRLDSILIPTLIEIYTNTVNLTVRRRAIHVLVKLVYFTRDSVLKTVLKSVDLASFLAIVLAQQEHQSLVVAALQISNILMTKLPSLYHFYFEREGVIFEISKLAYLGVKHSLLKEIETTKKVEDTNPRTDAIRSNDDPSEHNVMGTSQNSSETKDSAGDTGSSTNSTTASAASQRLAGLVAEMRSMRDQPYEERTLDEQLDTIEKELEAVWTRRSSSEPNEERASLQGPNTHASTLEQLRALGHFIRSGSRSVVTAQKDEKGLGSGKTKGWIFERAKIIMDMFEKAGASGERGLHEGPSVLADLKRMAGELRHPGEASSKSVKELAGYFTRLGALGISSFEFLNSGLPQALLHYLTDTKGSRPCDREERKRVFIQEFMTMPGSDFNTSPPAAPFGILVKKMQEALTRMETFEVEVAQTSTGEIRNNSSSSLATQVRLKLSPDDGTEVPSGYQNLVVSIHAIATFRTLDEYLRPRLKPRLATPEKTSDLSDDMNGVLGMQEAGAKTKVKNPLPTTTRRSSRLQKLAGSEQSIASDANKESLSAIESKELEGSNGDKGLNDVKDTKGAKDFENSNQDDSYEDSDDDIEDMDYNLERRASVQSTKGVETSAIDLGSDVKMGDSTRTADDTRSTTADNSDSCSANSPTPTPTSPKKDRGSENRTQESSSSWHIQFSLHGTPISTDMTVYGAIHEFERKNGARPIFSAMYPIKYKRVNSPPPEQSALMTSSLSNDEADLTFTADMPKELPQHADYAPILGLLRVLHGLNDDWRRFYGVDDKIANDSMRHMEPHEFINSKISAKVNRQLEEPLIVASSCLPDWTVGLVAGFPFLFPFETRYTYLQSTAFGFSRSIMRWQNQQQRSGSTDQRDESQTFLGRIQRQKVRISRQKALESAVRVMDLYGANQAMLEVEYFDEVGTGLGPTLEFYSLVSKEFCKKSLKLWRDGDSEAATEYVTAPQGLYPRPMAHFKPHSDNEKKILKLFRSLGQFLAKAMLDSRIIDVPLSLLFVSQLLGRSLKPHLQLVSSIDSALARSLKSLQAFVTEKRRIYDMNLPNRERENALRNIELQGSRLEDMSLDFTLAGYPEIELKAGGSDIPVTIYNVEEYINLTVDMTVGHGIEAQIAAFKAGFNSVFAIQDLAGFRSEELVGLFGSGEEDWSYETLADSVKADHGFRSESRAFKNLLRVMSEFNKEERRRFLQFITGSPKLPIGGFKNLHPPFTVVCKPFEAPLKADDYLPSVMTCANYLKMPDYSSKEVTLAKFKVAYEEGQGSFHLS
ncbi:Ubiquitin fusion degradation protein 4 [Dissophora ornata]|nr:Ubiquitin fusion degradation protein 4 [Dissophora ornata]